MISHHRLIHKGWHKDLCCFCCLKFHFLPFREPTQGYLHFSEPRSYCPLLCPEDRSSERPLQTRMIWTDQRWSLESFCFFFFFLQALIHRLHLPLWHFLTLWTVRVQSPGGTKRVAPAASWEELAVIHAECVSGDWVTAPGGETAGSAHSAHCWNRRHLTFTRQARSVCVGVWFRQSLLNACVSIFSYI